MRRLLSADPPALPRLNDRKTAAPRSGGFLAMHSQKNRPHNIYIVRPISRLVAGTGFEPVTFGL